MNRFISFFIKDFMDYLISCVVGVFFVAYCFVITYFFPKSYMLIIIITAIILGVIYIFRPNILKKKSKK